MVLRILLPKVLLTQSQHLCLYWELQQYLLQ
jgi:hypothetical protein